MKFKIGDTVRINDVGYLESLKNHRSYGDIYWDQEMNKFIGTIFSINKINLNGHIKYEDRTGEHWLLQTNWLDLIEERDISMPKEHGATYGTDPSVDLAKGLKFDDQKPPVGLVFESFPRALIEVAKVAGFGAKRYGRGNCFQVEDAVHRYQDAQGRHILNQIIDGDLDPDSQLLHLAHSAWNALFLLELKMREKENEKN